MELGNSLELLDWNGDFNSAANWQASGEIGGTPGRVPGAVLRIDSVRLEGRRLIVRFTARAGARYALSYKADLSAPNGFPWPNCLHHPPPGSREFD